MGGKPTRISKRFSEMREEDKPKALQRCIMFMIYFQCFILELVGFTIALHQLNSYCLQAFEVTNSVLVYLLLTVPPIVPDFVFAITGIFLANLFIAPFSAAYNAVIGILCITGSAVGLENLTYCGNIAQSYLMASYYMGLVAGILHVFLALFTHFSLPKDEGYGLYEER